MKPTIGPDMAVLQRAAGADALPAAVRAGLGDPLARIAIALVARDGIRRLDCYAVAGAGAQLAAVTPDATGGLAASFPVAGAAAEALVAETLGLGQPLADVGHGGELDIAALWALAAMVDAHRQLELESLLARSLARRIALDEDTIYLRALDGATQLDPRWLSAMLTHLIGPGDVGEARLAEGLAALARAGMIARDPSGSWSPQPAFAAAFAHLEVPLSAVSLTIDRVVGSGVDRAELVFLRTVAAVWMIEPRRSADAIVGVALRSIGAEDARRRVHEAIARASTTQASPGGPAPGKDNGAASGFCRQCGQPAAATDRFCGHCGTKLPGTVAASAATTSDACSQQDLLAGLKSRLTALGLTVRDDDKQGLVGEVQPIRSKWLIGGRAVTYTMSCRPSEADHTVQFREAIAESSWGIPPPTASAGTSKVSGWKLSGERTDASPGGGGSIGYAQVRDAVEQAVTAAGWTYRHQGGRMP